jgi:heme iron utilization protein
MDASSLQALATLVRSQRVAALGTLYDGSPLVSLVPYAADRASGAFHIHISRLAQHTRAIESDGRVGLMIAEPDTPGANPQTLARLSIRGSAFAIAAGSGEFEAARAAYLAKFPEAAFNFTLQDFSLYRIVPVAARFVGGFGRIVDLSADELRAAQN